MGTSYQSKGAQAADSLLLGPGTGLPTDRMRPFESEGSSRGPRSAGLTEIRWDKRALDLVCLLAGLPVALPVMLLAALFIKLVSPGPIFFRQVRVGFRERRFRIYKFRSMHRNAETRSHESHTEFLFKASDVPMAKLDDRDTRLIPMGWLLRASGLDELPQLINVLKGEMSVIGPRPCTEKEYAVLHPWHKIRFDALPGLTGLWQVSGKNKTTFAKMIELDVEYARNRSLGLDLKIILRTFPVLFGQIGEMWRKKLGKQKGAQ